MARICMLVTSELSKDPRVQKEASISHSAGHDVTVICRSYSGKEEFPYNVVPISTKRRNGRWLKLFERFLTIFLLIRFTIKVRPNIIHANDLDTLPAAYLAGIMTRSRLVYDSHEIWPDVWNFSDLVNNVIDIIQRFLSRKADAVITVNEYCANHMAKKLKIPKPIAILNAPYYVQTRELSSGEWVRQFAGKKIVLHQGRFVANRGLHAAVLAAKYLSDDVVLVFRGYGAIENELRQLVKDNALSEHVFFVPPVPMNDLVVAAVGADIGLVLYNPVHHSHVNVGPNKLFEYMMAGVPCVASDLPYLREILCGLEMGDVFPPGDAEEMANVITRMLDRPDRLALMRQHCFEYAKQFSWDVEGGKLLKVYESISAKNS